MPILAEVLDYHDELTVIRRDIHAHPSSLLPSSAPLTSSRPGSPSSGARFTAASLAPG